MAQINAVRNDELVLIFKIILPRLLLAFAAPEYIASRKLASAVPEEKQLPCHYGVRIPATKCWVGRDGGDRLLTLVSKWGQCRENSVSLSS
jgi:hypothetical protein